MAQTQGPAAAREVLAGGARLLAAARDVAADHDRAVGAVRAALAPITDELARGELAGIPVARLKDVTRGRLRLGAIEAAGYATVDQVLRADRYGLRQVPGVGPQTADQALAAARRIARAVEEAVAVRIDVEHPRPRTTALVVALHRLVAAGPGARRAVGAAAALDARLGPLLERAEPAGRSLLRRWFAGREKRAVALAAVDGAADVVQEAVRGGVPELLAQASVDLLRGPDEAEAWVEFELRSAEFYSLLAELSGRGPDVAAAEGFLPADVADRVRAQPLDDTLRRVSLRGYQSFGARFALAQRRVVLGDEMGLGKTVQAIAAMAHLAARGRTHFLVVCPASVLVNWTREVGARSALTAVPMHGPDRAEAYARWRPAGGVGVTTYDALRGFPLLGEGDGSRPGGPPGPVSGPAAVAGSGARVGAPLEGPGAPLELGMLVVDEAHYVKNPETRRSRSVAAWAEGCERVLFLTGTPMENRVAEFRNLVRHLQPDLVPGIGEADGAAGSQAFRRAVAPAYLRRNQRDVLAELPTLVRTDEWDEMGAADLAAYEEAVRAGNFMAMRRAAYACPRESVKLRRLCELVAEAADNGRKAVVFSYFREVLATVRDALGEAAASGRVELTKAGRPPAAYGPLTGSVPPARRQRLVDDFSSAPGHAVLLAQIEAGGVGLNLQAAAVVIICEPQVKPTIEHQAVARAHRMGQVRAVQVHRLLATTGVDQRMLAILESKERLFDAYARRSDVAEASPDAVDISDGSLARRIVEDEQRRLAERDGGTRAAGAGAGAGAGTRTAGGAGGGSGAVGPFGSAAGAVRLQGDPG